MKIDPEARSTARRIHKRGKVQKAHHLTGGKVRGIVQVESLTEVDFLNLCSLDPRVQEVHPQPVTYDLNTGFRYANKEGLLKRAKASGFRPWVYTPDFRVVLIDGTIFFLEAKSEYTLSKQPEILEYPRIFESFGEQLLLMTDYEISPELKKNLGLLRPFIGRPLPNGLLPKLKALDSNRFTYREAISDLGFTQGELFTAILTGHLFVDLYSTALKKDTELLVFKGCTKHLELLPL
ncbi:hypothetical protein K3X44_00045 [Aliiroseovarius crassostreae]|uniref:hypothetical protein n=1 Tax=Aliiroseovarius crassostreae TaxID=154981 RepID=UPI00220E1936|nr:hypothetical protein [Aliiroseovarius crassostreae]UWQ01795.1 hypothetical protein K3X44_00045 [Aliiroseovarius crassostreae]